MTAEFSAVVGPAGVPEANNFRKIQRQTPSGGAIEIQGFFSPLANPRRDQDARVRAAWWRLANGVRFIGKRPRKVAALRKEYLDALELFRIAYAAERGRQ